MFDIQKEIAKETKRYMSETPTDPKCETPLFARTKERIMDELYDDSDYMQEVVKSCSDEIQDNFFMYQQNTRKAQFGDCEDCVKQFGYMVIDLLEQEVKKDAENMAKDEIGDKS